MSDKIPEFHGKYRFLSNFWTHPVVYDGVAYPSLEHAYQSQKTLINKERDRINFHRKSTIFNGKKFDHVRPTSPGEAKREAGPKANHPITLRPDWDQIKFTVMEDLVRIKFQDPGLRKGLLETGDAVLEEGNMHHDNIWGICNCPKHGSGDNHLGKILMRVRSELRK